MTITRDVNAVVMVRLRSSVADHQPISRRLQTDQPTDRSPESIYTHAPVTSSRFHPNRQVSPIVNNSYQDAIEELCSAHYSTLWNGII